MIGPTWRSRTVQALLGPNRSQLVPTVLWTGWLDASGDVIAMTGLSVRHEAFGPAGDGVANTQSVDCGVAGDGWTIAALGLFDAAAGALIVSADLPAPVTPDEGDPLVFEPGALTFQVPA
ncbi:hypothetical protein [Cellulomonas sp. C5510]|uniref:hypothetical protein n=1 Tax=Cellulomonas sp. C5510 TaxID=2871170 RepID=UPI001C94BD8C|nr:hypothetical protein [Cellulomonas sp. C5510]QZN86874.1 hypothetical protein K5O09_07125 [Cellulomonas sp. C5510]